ncbi:hypothetical protein BDW74DRAFT_172576 [Aspergillus multicolor]|uniref:uncharacterized protein n=1 Tax=Aspergillus multicolor TaxID=41759 RepID=UPI003CCD200A
MNDADEYETTSVLICGCGPTGALLSAYLGRMKVPHIVLEREPAISTDPRGIALDEDGIRLLQGIGLYDKVYTEIGTCMQQFQFIGGTTTVLDQKPAWSIDYSTTEGATGHVGFICHKQPILERHLREAMQAGGYGELRTECVVTHLAEDENWTYCHYRDAQGAGATRRVRARFFVGADGKTGFTRKNYLEPLGVKMEFATDAFYDETWVALNWQITPPTPTTHPHFPLWAQGYTPEAVYDLFFPVHFRFLCNPERPAVCGRFGRPSDRLWRFEFVVRKDEDGETMARKEMIKRVVFPYITHPGNLYGLYSPPPPPLTSSWGPGRVPEDVQFPSNCIRVLRSRPYRFSARSCNRWARGRVVLVGDAAHVFPPFGGQGIASGFRDAVSLGWRLALLTRPREQPDGPGPDPGLHRPRHEDVLRAWYLERKQQLEQSLASTIANGRCVNGTGTGTISGSEVRVVSGWDRAHLVRYAHSPGMPFLPEYLGGLSLPQGYCKRVEVANAADSRGREEGAEDVDVDVDADADADVRVQGPRIYFTDDIIFAKADAGTRTGTGMPRLFRLLVYLASARDLAAALRDIADIEGMSRGRITADEVTILIERAESPGPSISIDMETGTLAPCGPGAGAGPCLGSSLSTTSISTAPAAISIYQVATGAEFAASPLCLGRPEPKRYDPYHIGRALGGNRYVLVRPDRVVFAAVDSRDDLRRAAEAAAGYLPGDGDT